jgi:hypothetical protein
VFQVLIDFGLAYTSTLVEDKAVDLYVLERALGATHPDGGRHMEQILLSYAYGLGDKEWRKVETRLKDGQLNAPQYASSHSWLSSYAWSEAKHGRLNSNVHRNMYSTSCVHVLSYLPMKLNREHHHCLDDACRHNIPTSRSTQTRTRARL